MAEKKPKQQDKDDPTRAPESGEPEESGRSHGNVINDSGRPAGERKDHKGDDTDYESGRHGAQ